MTEQMIKPDYIFETSWEVCNKVGGIYTVLSTKALSVVNDFNDNYIVIGPDIWMGNTPNPEFTEDKFLYRSWREEAEENGLRLRIGRWNIAGNPITILVDFTHYFADKDKIFAAFWENYKLDSISGQWDYIEPALFGYAAAKTIESFYEYNLSANDKIIAHFHEWMTGTGILYLKKFVPQVGTVFTTHATVLGRCIAGNGLPLYNNLTTYNPEIISKEFGVVSKYSLEKLSAIEADGFTTVSEITNNECKQFFGKAVDFVTPNGFEDSFVPTPELFDVKRSAARKKILNVFSSLTNQKLKEDSMLIINSGRYEFKNKGIDLFIDAMGELNKRNDLERDVIAVIAVPAHQAGLSHELLERLENPDFNNPISNKYLTHRLYEAEKDPVLQQIYKNGLYNSPQDKVKIFFVPSYLNGNDGIFNLEYYDFLIGFDGSVFPSYYEPWGYTPMESLAFHIPTITTCLAGFGLWIKTENDFSKSCINVIDRRDDNDADVVEQINNTIFSCSLKSQESMNEIRKQSYEISRSTLWKNLITYYYNTYSLAVTNALSRSDLFIAKKNKEFTHSVQKARLPKPEWKKILIKPSIPKNLECLQRLTKNLWWTWNYEASELFEMIDEKRWVSLKYNPIALIESLSMDALVELEHNTAFLEKLSTVTALFDAYMSKTNEKPKEQIAYFSMEYGLHDTLKIFSGGLGMLAGDYLKEASDCNVNMVGIGLLYRYGYFQQNISISGDQIANYTPQKFTHLPLIPVRNENGDWVKISFGLPGRILYAKVWRVDVGRIPLYLLDTDIEDNSEADRSVTHRLYGGDWENRLKQELLLGIGGIQMLDILGLTPTIYHCNEGHAAFITIERLLKFIQNDKLAFEEAVEVVRSSTLFTTHTPVPAGHDTFSEDLMRVYMPYFAEQLNISWEQFMNLGRFVENDVNEKFSMSVLAFKLSQEVNGVSRIHGSVSQEMFCKLYPGYFPSEIHVGYVTNGVHLPTWASKSWQKLYSQSFGCEYLNDQSNPEYWEKILDVPDDIIWNTRLKQKKQLIDYLHFRLTDEMTKRNENPKLIFKLMDAFNPNALTIGFARRFATYKRAHLLFSNLERLSKLVNNAEKPVQFVFAGKAHPNDKAGQDLIKRIMEISKQAEFIGKITFVENYDIELAKYLIRGVDIWLNTPTRPLEASGTSGEKAIMNGVVNFSVLDGWWAEGFTQNAGWALKEEQTYENQDFQNELDAETIYSMFEDEIIPAYYDKNNADLPEKWISIVKNTIAKIAPHFTMKRQLDDYFNKYYNKLINRTISLQAENYLLARRISKWKRKVSRGWDSIEILSVNLPDSNQAPLVLGENFKAEIKISLNELSGIDLGMEVLFGQKENDEVKQPLFVYEMKVEKAANNILIFNCDIPANTAGVYDYAFRMYPKHEELPHRQDFALVRWI
ncbi:MAG: alpha-glucan family phosphorylase [Bacteroidetes bacterium]|nr:alpha-glucan family phosphorylase [Bacteroidota bacterium]